MTGFGLLAGGTLTAAGSAGLTGCGLLRRPAQQTNMDPLLAVRDQAQALAERYAAVIAAKPKLAELLGPMGDAHRRHVTELSAVIGIPATSAGPPSSGGSPSVVPTDEPKIFADLAAAEEAAQQAATAVCLSVPAARAGLVGSIVACRASHAEVLRTYGKEASR